jgi:RNA polymerase sigma-70 factor, ECF subfamily
MSLCAHVTSESTHLGRRVVVAPTPLFVLSELPTRPEPQPTTATSFKDELLAATPFLRAVAILMVGCSDRADDFVQDTLLKAWVNRGRFESGTNLRGWLFTILRNTHYSQHRKSEREIEDVGGALAQRLSTPASRDDHMNLEDFKIALSRIPPIQREALILVEGSGFSYDEAAALCGCLVGTIESRVSRARSALAEMLGVEPRGLSENGAPIG